jgi:hypothetical protein
MCSLQIALVSRFLAYHRWPWRQPAQRRARRATFAHASSGRRAPGPCFLLSANSLPACASPPPPHRQSQTCASIGTQAVCSNPERIGAATPAAAASCAYRSRVYGRDGKEEGVEQGEAQRPGQHQHQYLSHLTSTAARVTDRYKHTHTHTHTHRVREGARAHRHRSTAPLSGRVVASRPTECCSLES